jgi:bifunctional non-homologous end joining protein LigD
MPTPDPLQRYRAKRRFELTREPAGKLAPRGATARTFVVQKHAARSLHYDFRLELAGVLKSWAVPKGPSLDPSVKRMAVEVEDHPLEYATFEGEIPKGEYGAGRVIVWDSGKWMPQGDPVVGLRAGKLEFELRGKKLAGRWNLVRMRRRAGAKHTTWLLIKGRDDKARPEKECSVVDAMPGSVRSRGRVVTARRKENGGQSRAAAITPGTKKRARSARSTPPLPSGIYLTHPDRIIDTSTGITKRELMQYYLAAAPRLIAQLRGRPVAMVRGPEGVQGTLFFQKHAGGLRIPTIKELDKSLDPGNQPLLEIATRAALFGAVQLNVLEFHTWNAGVRAIEKPDRIVFDLDPGTGVGWPLVREAARRVRALLEELELRSFLKTSGGHGLHVIVPLQPRFDWKSVRAFSQAVVLRLAQQEPKRFVAKSGPRNRIGRIFIDYLRNGRGATTVAAWSTRARPGIAVSVPLGWDELATLRGAAQWTIRNVHERLQADDPWAGYARVRQSLRPALEAMVGSGANPA